MLTTKKCCLALLIFLSCIIYANSYADDSTPMFSCTLTDTKSADGTLGDATDKFTPDTAMIYLSCYSDAIKEGQKIKAVWIADDTNDVAPPNYVIDKKELEITPAIISADKGATANFSLSKPTKGWPVGSYHVDLYVDETLDQSVKFTVK